MAPYRATYPTLPRHNAVPQQKACRQRSYAWEHQCLHQGSSREVKCPFSLTPKSRPGDSPQSEPVGEGPLQARGFSWGCGLGRGHVPFGLGPCFLRAISETSCADSAVDKDYSDPNTQPVRAQITGKTHPGDWRMKVEPVPSSEPKRVVCLSHKLSPVECGWERELSPVAAAGPTKKSKGGLLCSVF